MSLDSEGMALDCDLITRALASAPLPFTLRYFPTLDSTNTYAMRVPPDEAQEGLVIITDHQTAGRGRLGRVWGGVARQQLTFSVILTPPFAANWLMMASALAVHEAITGVTGLAPAIKWPNDVLTGGKKVCGILIETSGEIAVIGIGVVKRKFLEGEHGAALAWMRKVKDLFDPNHILNPGKEL